MEILHGILVLCDVCCVCDVCEGRGVFGVPLVTLVTSEGADIPKIVRRIVEYVELNGNHHHMTIAAFTRHPDLANPD